MQFNARNLWYLIRQTMRSWTADYAPSMGAALAYYTVFSMAPLLLIVIAVSGMVFGEEAARANTRGWFSLVRARLLSFGMILAIGFLLTVSLLASATLKLMGRWLEPVFGSWYVVVPTAEALGSFLLVAAMFALIYKTMPRAPVQWRDVWTGALFTSVLFGAGKYAIGLYLGQSGIISGYGAAGSLVIILLWFYYSAQIFLMGAEFTWVYANTYGSRRPVTAK
jgi:membrane protein